jgi:16S rRNA (cytosine967-C5)-methyltransferase
LRDFGRGDFFLGQLLATPLKEATVRGLLLAALVRLEARPEEAHTTVDQAVEAAARLAGGRFKSLVNGVLRSFLRRADSLIAEANEDEHARWRHPEWWIARLKHDHPQQWQAILAAGNSRPPMTLRVNPRRPASADFPKQLEAAGIPIRTLGDGALLLAKPVAVDRIPGFADGSCSVQDAGAQRAALLLDCQNGMRVLDACAAPGGKTAHLLEIHDLDLLALDSDANRATRIDETLGRLGLQANVVSEDCRDLKKWWDGTPFDRILADVPCSASGVVRRHPDAKWLRRAGDIAGLARQQAEIIDALWQTLAPGGKMLYATCSVFADENARQVEKFVGRHADARRLPTGGAEPELQLLPNAEHDGFYYALIEKI